MSPIYEYRCPDGHIAERLTSVDGAEIVTCECGKKAQRIMSVPAKRTDGIYSYAPNIGDPDLVERSLDS